MEKKGYRLVAIKMLNPSRVCLSLSLSLCLSLSPSVSLCELFVCLSVVYSVLSRVVVI